MEVHIFGMVSENTGGMSYELAQAAGISVAFDGI
jgi:hypothetical protein